MSYYTELLDLESEDLSILGDVYNGYALSLIKKEEAAYFPYIASCFVVAGILKTLLNPGEGKLSFSRASEYYIRLKNNYWIVCKICENDTDGLLETLKSDSEYIYRDMSVFEYVMISEFIENRKELVNDELNLSYPVGRLNIPLKIYIDAIQSLEKQENSQHVNTIPIELFLNRASEYIRFLKNDFFHWQNLEGDFLYVEPETLAFCMALCRKMVNNSLDSSLLLERVRLDPLSKLPLQLANDILKGLR